MWFLLGVVIAAYLINIKLAVALNDWNGRFYNALQVVNKEEILEVLKEVIKPGDVVLLKASNGMKFYELAERMISLWKKKD
mgnify:CR=1 FL=1